MSETGEMTEGARGRASVRRRAWAAANRYGLVLVVAVTTFVPGCSSEVRPEAVSAHLVASGEFEIQKGLPTLVSPSSEIKCELGRIFGVDYRIDVTGGEYGVVPVEFRWLHPELAVPSSRLWGTETAANRPNPRIEWRETSLEGRALWTLEHPDELVSGRYEFQVRRRGDGSVLLSHSFVVEGC